MAGGVPVYVPLRSSPGGPGPAWTLDVQELEEAITERTRVFILNTPHNPTGKVMDAEEMEKVAEVMRRHPGIVVICDEVYEHMTYDERAHVQFPTLPGMWEQCVTVSSAGKTFSTTGWKIGWVVGPAALVKGVALVNQWVQFSVCTPLQQAVAWALQEAQREYEGFPTYFHYLRSEYLRKRGLLCDALHAAGLTVVPPEGGFFVMADTSSVSVPDKYMQQSTPACPTMTRDWAFCRWLTCEIGVTAIPPSAFYQPSDKHLVENFARFAFCKQDASLAMAAERLLKLKAAT